MTTDDAPLRVGPEPDRLALSGEIDAHTAGLLRDALVEAQGTDDLLVDFSGVTFIDSSGLRVVLELHQNLDRDGRRLVLIDPSRPVTRLLELTGLVSHLHVDPPLEAKETDQFVADTDR